eukprot:6337865-Prymnesium_polylepis.2
MAEPHVRMHAHERRSRDLHAVLQAIVAVVAHLCLGRARAFKARSSSTWLPSILEYGRYDDTHEP